MISKYFFSSLLFFLAIHISNSQNLTSLENDYLWFDKQVGVENTTLFNGLRYEEEYRVIDGNHKFYESPDFLTGDMFYDNQPYYNIKMKYDLFEDQIIINLITNNGNNNILKLLNSKIDSFTIKDKHFINLLNIPVINSTEKINGIFQTLFKDDTFVLFKKNIKNVKKIISKDYLYHNFINDHQYYCYFNKTYYTLNSKKDWTKVFPKYKKDIQSYYKKNKTLNQSDLDSFLIQLSIKLSSSNAFNTSLK